MQPFSASTELPPLPPQPLGHPGHLLSVQPSCCQNHFLVDCCVDCSSLHSQIISGCRHQLHIPSNARSSRLSPLLHWLVSWQLLHPLFPSAHISGVGSQLQAQCFGKELQTQPYWLPDIRSRLSILPGKPGSALCCLWSSIPLSPSDQKFLLADCHIAINSLPIGFMLSPWCLSPSVFKNNFV